MCSQNKETFGMDSLKEAKSLGDIDFQKIDLQRGDTPQDIKERCLKLCKEYLSGNWLSQTVDSIEVRRVSGGLTNQLYFGGITKPSQTSDVPQEVAVRLYGAKHMNTTGDEDNERLSDVVIGLLTSENGLGPKMYGIFQDGQFNTITRTFTKEEQNDNELTTELFQKLARVHAMDVPIKKNHWYLGLLDKFFASIEIELGDGLAEMIREANCLTLLDNALKAEVNWLKDMIEKNGSPLVFCHNDFRSCNIMVLENNNVAPDDRLVLCDFEYSSYGYRGHDFGTIINEWGRNANDMKEMHKYPDDTTLRQLIRIYVEESKKILGDSYSDSVVNSEDHILKEVKFFSLAYNLWCAVWYLRHVNGLKDMQMDRKVGIQFAEVIYKNYLHHKKIFLSKNASNF